MNKEEGWAEGISEEQRKINNFFFASGSLSRLQGYHQELERLVEGVHSKAQEARSEMARLMELLEDFHSG